MFEVNKCEQSKNKIVHYRDIKCPLQYFEHLRNKLNILMYIPNFFNAGNSSGLPELDMTLKKCVKKKLSSVK